MKKVPEIKIFLNEYIKLVNSQFSQIESPILDIIAWNILRFKHE